MLGVLSALAGDIRLNTVVIDAGHGGKDPGAISKDKNTQEKSLTLSIATKLADNIKKAYPDVNVVMTRTTDHFVELRDRARIANKAGANLFISIHINAAASRAANGYSVHILGQSSNKNRDLFAYNMDVVKRENSVILLEDDYKTKYQGFNPNDEESYIFMELTQNAYLEQSMILASIISDKLKGGPIAAGRGIWQNPFYVLWSTSMPSVLCELGFISNDNDLAALRQESKRDEIAHRLFLAFKDYKDLYDSSVDVDANKAGKKEAVKEGKPAEAGEEAGEDAGKPKEADTLYGTQIFASSRSDIDPRDPMFMGYTPTVISIGSLYKYIIGLNESPDKARELNVRIREQYPASFMVKIESGSVSRFK